MRSSELSHFIFSVASFQQKVMIHAKKQESTMHTQVKKAINRTTPGEPKHTNY